MLSRCSKTMIICTNQAFVQGPAASTLVGQSAASLGPEVWVYEDIEVAVHLVLNTAPQTFTTISVASTDH